MSYLRWIIRPYLFMKYLFQKNTKTGSFGGSAGEYVQTEYVETGNPVKDGLRRHHVKQFHESSCSVASVVSVINTLLDIQRSGKFSPVTQHELLNTVRAAHWKERMSSGGYKGRRGLPLDVLEAVVRGSLDVYGIAYRSVEKHQTFKDRISARRNKIRLFQDLDRFEKQGDVILIAHFDQGSFLPEYHIPHISPVGGFDPGTCQVTVLDVDTTQPYPYRVSLDTFYKGISYDYNLIFKHYGYGAGGYILIRL